jgi:uncharacterized protein YoaH (UPF0181 family)
MITLTHEEAQQVLHSLLNYPMTEGKAIKLLRAKLNEPQRKWVGLTDEEIKLYKPVCADFNSFRAGVRTVEILLNKENIMKCQRCGKVNPAEVHTCTPQHEWVGLTDDEINAAWGNNLSFARAIEAKLKEKNNG